MKTLKQYLSQPTNEELNEGLEELYNLINEDEDEGVEHE